MRLVVSRTIPDDATLRRQWNALVHQMEHPEVFYTYEWSFAVASAYPSSLQPLLVLGYEQDALVGVASLTTHAGRDEEIGFLSGTTADYCDFVSRPEMRLRWCDAVFRELQMLSGASLTLANLPADSRTAQLLSEVAANCGFRVYSRPAYHCARIVFGSAEERDSLRRSIEAKKLFRRNLNAINKKGQTVFTHDVHPDELDSAIAEFCNAHVARFLATGRLSNLVRPERRRFLLELARQLSPAGWLAFSRLQIGHEVAAWNYGFRFAGAWFWYQPTFAEEFERFSPGFCLLCRLIEDACRAPDINVFDMGLGAEGYKDRFATASRQTLHVTATSSRATYLKTALRSHAGSLARSVPALHENIQRLRDRASNLMTLTREQGISALLRIVAVRLRRMLFTLDAVRFYEWPESDVVDRLPASLSLERIDTGLMAIAAAKYVDDPGTLTYLLRAARRLHRKKSEGFALVTADRVPLHFSWLTDYEGFYMDELRLTLKAPHPDAVLLFDSWTPVAARGQNWFGITAAEIARQVARSGKIPWIFAAQQNHGSVTGIEKTQFKHRFTMRRRRLLAILRRIDLLRLPTSTLASRSASAA